MKLIPTILCGGAGSRLWPVSREAYPKPFMRLADGDCLLNKTYHRAISLPAVAEVVTVTNRELFFETRDIYKAQPQPVPLSFILEPFGRNTAAAIASSALYIQQKYGDDAVMLVLAADHLIQDHAAFAAAIEEACTLAQQSTLVTLGIHPTSPETGYGYIQAEGHQVLQFVEKPSLDKAQSYLTQGNYWWNAGIFCFTVKTMLDAMQRYCPEVIKQTQQCMTQSEPLNWDPVYQGMILDKTSFAAVPDISVDYAVMEKASDIAVVPCDIGWSDIGSWKAMSELVTPDVQGNRVDGSALLIDSERCYVRSDKRVIAGVGLHDLYIIDTPDALLVADSQHAQAVRQVYAQLKETHNPAYKEHRTVHRPWGTYTLLDEGDGYKIKHIEVSPGASLSLQMHHHRSEHWVVVSGMAEVTNGDSTFYVNTNESTYIPAGNKHRLSNPGILPLVIVEVQSGRYLGEDDIVRFEDIYGRVSSSKT